MKISCSNNCFFSEINHLKDKVVGIVGVVASIAMMVFGGLLLPTPAGIALAVGGTILLQGSLFAATGFFESCCTPKKINAYPSS